MMAALIASIPTMLASILIKCMTEKFLARVLILGMGYLAGKTTNTVDDELVEAFREAYYGPDEVPQRK